MILNVREVNAGKRTLYTADVPYTFSFSFSVFRLHVVCVLREWDSVLDFGTRGMHERQRRNYFKWSCLSACANVYILIACVSSAFFLNRLSLFLSPHVYFLVH